ncbi:MAG TPA: glycosyltransferase family 2 protein [Kofleriaceae bacterium]|nr:glycosyltransferase family 2 protein [Kofleriaceae bacterium]
MTSHPQGAPEISVVIPIYNEEGILREAVTSLVTSFRDLGWAVEIILAENGSTDSTPKLAAHLAGEIEEVCTLSVGEPNYGRALREGILMARGQYVICEEIDLCDIDFATRSLALLRSRDAEMVVGSKAMKGAHDARPMLRRAATRVINGMLRVAVGFRGTDTHGLKAFVREVLTPVVKSCVVERDLFASELVIRAARAGVTVVEIPVRVAEKRRPAVNLIRRVPNVLSNLARLTYVIRVKK